MANLWESFITWTMRLAGLYLAAGMLVAIPFAVKGVNRIDPAARGSTVGFRLIILPGAVALWPLLLLRLLRGQTQPPAPCDAHRRNAAKEAS